MRPYAFATLMLAACAEGADPGPRAEDPDTAPTSQAPVPQAAPTPELVQVECDDTHHAAVDVGGNPDVMPIPRVDAWQVNSEGTWEPLDLESLRDGELAFICAPEKGEVTAWIWP